MSPARSMFLSGRPGRGRAIREKSAVIEPARGFNGGDLFELSASQLSLQKRMDLEVARRHATILADATPPTQRRNPARACRLPESSGPLSQNARRRWMARRRLTRTDQDDRLVAEGVRQADTLTIAIVASRKRARRGVRRSGAAKPIMRPAPARRARRDSDVAFAIARPSAVSEAKAIASVMLAFRRAYRVFGVLPPVICTVTNGGPCVLGLPPRGRRAGQLFGRDRRRSCQGQPHVWEVPSESWRGCEDVYASAVAGAAAGSAAFAVPLLVLGRR